MVAPTTTEIRQNLRLFYVPFACCILSSTICIWVPLPMLLPYPRSGFQMLVTSKPFIKITVVFIIILGCLRMMAFILIFQQIILSLYLCFLFELVKIFINIIIWTGASSLHRKWICINLKCVLPLQVILLSLL